MKAPSLLLAVLAFLFPLACFDSSTAGRDSVGDDFPNTVAARTAMSDFLDSSRRWESPAEPPDPALSLEGKVTLPVGKKAAPPPALAAASALAKLPALPKAAAESAITLYDDTARGRLTVINHKREFGRTSRDTLALGFKRLGPLVLPDFARIFSLRGAAEYDDGRVEGYSWLDLDGDGILGATPGRTSAVSIAVQTRRPRLFPGMTEEALLEVEAGPDGDFDAEGDNRVRKALWVKTAARRDTLEAAQYFDADGDSAAVDNARTSTVLLLHYRKDPPDPEKREVAESRTLLRLRLAPKTAAADSGREAWIGFSGEELLKGGRLRLIGLASSDSGSSIGPEDTLRVTVTEGGLSEGSPLRQGRLGPGLDRPFALSGEIPDSTGEKGPWQFMEMRMGTGADLEREEDDLLYGLVLRRIRKPLLREGEREAFFSFLSDRPLRKGETPSGGELKLALALATGDSVGVSGRLTTSKSGGGMETVFTGTYRQSAHRDGKSYAITWKVQSGLVTEETRLEPLP